MKLKQLRSRLDELKKNEAIAQTREQLLNEEKEQLLSEVMKLLSSIRLLKIVPEENISSNNLMLIIKEVEDYMETEIAKSSIPPELL